MTEIKHFVAEDENGKTMFDKSICGKSFPKYSFDLVTDGKYITCPECDILADKKQIKAQKVYIDMLEKKVVKADCISAIFVTLFGILLFCIMGIS